MKIPSKEGVISAEGRGEDDDDAPVLVPFRLMEPQIYLTREVMLGLAQDVHLFWVLKCRQSGTSTWCLAFIAFWCMSHPGMVFSMISPDTDLRETNRDLLSGMINSLPEEWRQEIVTDNRVMLKFANGSKIIWLNANAKKDKKSGLAQGIGMLGVHGTELGSWEDEDGVRSLMASLAQRNPNRFYIFEGTSKGPGLFKDYWTGSSGEELEAKSIFQGWWLHPFYRLDLKIAKHRQLFDTFWKPFPKLSREESRWVPIIKERYGYELTSEQLGWWRFMQKKPFKGRLDHLLQEYPPLPEHAFSYGGTNYVSSSSISFHTKEAKAAGTQARFFRLSYGTRFEHLAVKEVDARTGEFYDLTTWEDPVINNYVRYIVSLDPHHGANERSDLAVIEVFRAYSDSLVQVAEFVTRDWPAVALAWAILELAGAYHAETRVCVELQGGGYAVNDELQRLAREMAEGYDANLVHHFEKISYYRWSRPDATRSQSMSYHWITSHKTKEFMLDRYRDLWEQGKIVVRSPELIAETRDAVKTKEGEVVPSREDNRLMAAALAVVAYFQTIDLDIGVDKAFSRNSSMERERSPENETPEGVERHYLNQRLTSWKADLASKMAEEKEEMKMMKELAGEANWRQDYDKELNSQSHLYR